MRIFHESDGMEVYEDGPGKRIDLDDDPDFLEEITCPACGSVMLLTVSGSIRCGGCGRILQSEWMLK